MNRDDIIRMAREVGDVETDSRGRETFNFDCYGLEHFANLVAAAEREACIKVCLEQKYGGDWSDCADAIRARGEK